MNIGILIQRYFRNLESVSRLEVFDTENIYAVYKDIIHSLVCHIDVDVSVLQPLSYCFYEILDNVITHSGKSCGTAVMSYDEENHKIKILVADDGIGIRETLSQNSEYANVTEAEAIRLCINDKVSDGKGMGFGLYSTSRLIKNAGVNMIICSGSKEMNFDGKEFLIKEVPFWQGTVVYFELESNKQIDPNEVVESRTDCESQFNDTFLGNEELDNLW